MRIEEFKKLVNKLTLEDIEMNGGHVLSCHDHVTDSFLINRIINEGKKCATTFDISREEILKSIKETLLDEEFETPECILEWINDSSDGGLFIAEKEYDTVIGHGFFKAKWHEWSEGAKKCCNMVVVLRKEERTYDTTFKIVTAYPEPVV